MKKLKKITLLILGSLLVHALSILLIAYVSNNFLTKLISKSGVETFLQGFVGAGSFVFFVLLYRKVKAELMTEAKQNKINNINHQNELYNSIVQLKEELKKIKKNKETAINYQKIERASELRNEEKRIINEISAKENELHKILKKK